MSRLQLSEASASTESAEASVHKLQGELTEAQQMIATLEEDLQAAENRAVGNSPTAEPTAGVQCTSAGFCATTRDHPSTAQLVQG